MVPTIWPRSHRREWWSSSRKASNIDHRQQCPGNRGNGLQQSQSDYRGKCWVDVQLNRQCSFHRQRSSAASEIVPTLCSAITDTNTERRKVYDVSGLPAVLLHRRQWFPKPHHYGRWDMGATFHRNKESIYGMETHLVTCAEEIQNCAISREGHGHYFLHFWRSCVLRIYEKGHNH